MEDGRSKDMDPGEFEKMEQLRAKLSGMEDQVCEIMLDQQILIKQAMEIKSEQEIHTEHLLQLTRLIDRMSASELSKVAEIQRRQLFIRWKSNALYEWKRSFKRSKLMAEERVENLARTEIQNSNSDQNSESQEDAIRIPLTAETSTAENDKEISRKIRLKFMRQRIQDAADEISVAEVVLKLQKCDISGLYGDFIRNFLGIRKRNAVRGIAGSRIIHPDSPFNSCVQVLLTVLLVYSVFLVPFQLSFWDNQDPCVVYPSLYFDMFADACFVVDLFLSFFIGIKDAQGNYVDSLSGVAYIQLTNPWLFWFNLATSIPVSWIDWRVAELCQAYGSEGAASPQNWQSVGLLRAVKPIRLLKLIRLLRAKQIYTTVAELLDINPIYPRVFRILFCLVPARLADIRFAAQYPSHCLSMPISESSPMNEARLRSPQPFSASTA